MNIHEALYTTRAMRQVRPDPIPRDVQARILDAAIRAPTIGQEWRFLLVDDPAVKAQLAPLYHQAFERLMSQYGVKLEDMLRDEGPMGRSARSGYHVAVHFGEVPLLLIGFSRSKAGSSIDQALWSAMLAARAEGVGSAWTDILRPYFEAEVCEILGVPRDAGWHMHSVITMGYPTGRWGIAPRKPVHEVAARNSWEGALGFTVPEPLWPR